jgi:hypothetical protein
MAKGLNYDELIDDLLEIDENYTLIRGYSDIENILVKIGSYTESIFQFKDLKKDNFHIIIGRCDEDDIIKTLEEESFDVEREGEYEFILLLRYNQPEYESGHMIMDGYYEIVKSRIQFLQTFEERERELKLNEILLDEFDNLFKYTDESVN